MNYRNELKECLAYFISVFEYAQFQCITFGLPNLILHFKWLLGRKVPKLLERYNIRTKGVLVQH